MARRLLLTAGLVCILSLASLAFPGIASADGTVRVRVEPTGEDRSGGVFWVVVVIFFLLGRFGPDVLVIRYGGLTPSVYATLMQKAAQSFLPRGAGQVRKAYADWAIEAYSFGKAVFFCGALFWRAPVWTGVLLGAASVPARLAARLTPALWRRILVAALGGAIVVAPSATGASTPDADEPRIAGLRLPDRPTGVPPARAGGASTQARTAAARAVSEERAHRPACSKRR